MRALIVEDELEGMENLILKLEKHCGHLEIVGKCSTGESAIRAIREKRPQVVFLDIELGTMTGFDVLNKVQYIPFEVIFTTSYDDYAIQALRANAIDYLLKPIRPAELIKAVESAGERIQTSTNIHRIIVPNGKSFQVMRVNEIMYCLADNVYTKIHRPNIKPFLVAKTLKATFEMLPKDKFARISRSAIVNLDYVETFHRADGGFVTMRNKVELSISKSRLDDFLRKLGGSL
ncbi:MAG: LytTR family DNA-binding domain-containing protein [Bacteroidota bacterium]